MRAAVQARLLEWYAREKRDLPWRRTRDAYAILVAEVMLQQTQVDRVIPKWHDWLARFPTLGDLAAASRADAIRAWQGLGYNLRAVRLHAIACQVVAELGGELPRTVEGLLALNGVGRYTAGAVACFAYEQPVAMVDTNIRRVLSRLLRVDPREVETLADALVPGEHAYGWNQALMDLGATICRARRPLCLLCPLVADCGGPRPAARRTGASAEAFEGSSRYHRGRVVDYLRVVPPGTRAGADEVCRSVAAPRSVIDSLVRDGLVRVGEDGGVALA